MSLNPEESRLLQTAQDLVRKRFTEGKHHVTAALRTSQGGVFRAMHVEATVGRAAVCAEAIAIGMALAEADARIDTIVAVDRNGNVMPPCGICRELILDYFPDARVIVPASDGAAAVQIAGLLPFIGTRSPL